MAGYNKDNVIVMTKERGVEDFALAFAVGGSQRVGARLPQHLPALSRGASSVWSLNSRRQAEPWGEAQPAEAVACPAERSGEAERGKRVIYVLIRLQRLACAICRPTRRRLPSREGPAGVRRGNR